MPKKKNKHRYIKNLNFKGNYDNIIKLKSTLENVLSINSNVLFEFWYLPSFEDKYYIQVGFNSYNSLILKYIYTNNIDTFSNIIYLNDIQSKMILNFANLDFNITTPKDVLIIDGIYYTIRFKNNIYNFEKSNIPNEYFKIYTLCEEVLKIVKYKFIFANIGTVMQYKRRGDLKWNGNQKKVSQHSKKKKY